MFLYRNEYVLVQGVKTVVRSKIDQSDPNPAHKLKRTLEDLTLSYGTTVNPRFADTRHKSKIPRRHSSANLIEPPTKAASKKVLRKSVTLGGLESSEEDPASLSFLSELSRTKKNSSEEEEGKEDMAAATLTNGHRSRKSLYSKNSSTVLDCIEEDNDIEVTNTETETTVFLKNILSRGSLAASETSSRNERSNARVQDIEVDSTENETTIYLKGILGCRSGDNPSLGSVNEEDVGYYEVPDEDAELITASWRYFPHGIPRVCVLDETGELVEVIVDPPQTTPDYPPQSRESWNDEPSTRL